ncbi:MAG: GyrI-like domain-containing protein [Pseudomonadota bacterium]
MKPSGRVISSEVPAFRVARTVYRGQMEGLGQAWGELQEWIKANGHAAQQQMLERYVVGPGDTPDAAKWQTELNWPLA